MPPKIILASSSLYRKKLFERLRINFACEASGIDESPKLNETARSRALRLAENKAREVAKRHEHGLVIGSDQMAQSDNTHLDKPGDVHRAKQHLAQLSGKTVIFYTGLCLLNIKDKQYESDVIKYQVVFRVLTAHDIENYLNQETPFDCAGGFKSEGLGISLIEEMQGPDPSALIGLPLIRLCQMLRHQGIQIP